MRSWRSITNYYLPLYYVFLGSYGIYYEELTSERGKRLILINGYTYSCKYKSRWVCSTHTPQCKAKLKMSNDGVVTSMQGTHIHPMRRYVKIPGGGYLRLPLENNLQT